MSPLRPEIDEPLLVLALEPVAWLNGWLAGGPGGSWSAAQWCVAVSISDRLFELNERGIPDPNLISSYSLSGNGTTWRFQIHSDRRFHNGEEVTSDDVIHSLLQAAQTWPEGARLHDLVDVKVTGNRITGNGIRRISRYRFEMQLRERAEGFLQYLALPCNSIWCRSSAADAPDRFGGPYRVTRRDPGEWELRLEPGHPAAHPAAYERVIVRGLSPEMSPLEAARTEDRARDMPPGPQVVLFDRPFGAEPKSAASVRDLLLRMPGERLYYLRLCAQGGVPVQAARTLRQALEAPALQKAFFGLKPVSFAGVESASGEAAPAVRPKERAGASAGGARSPAREPSEAITIGLEPGAPPESFLEALSAECRSRGLGLSYCHRPETEEQPGAETAVVSTTSEARTASAHQETSRDQTASAQPVPLSGAGSPEIQAWLGSAFVGHAMDELGFFHRIAQGASPGCRRPGKGYLAALTAAAQAPVAGLRADALRRLAREMRSDLKVIPLFQSAAAVLLDPRIDREAANSAAGFTSLVCLRRRSARFDHAELNQAMLTALGAATQMFAHDVRRPFSMVRILLDMIRNAGSLVEVREMAARLMPEVERALGAVNGMIQDILEIGTARDPVREIVPPERVVQAALREVFEPRVAAEVKFTYRLSHAHPFHASEHQVHRVFANILSNAADAMQNKGNIWFETEDVLSGGRPFVRVCIGNTGSSIDPAELPRIFDAFYSRQKRSGTGLGLAIARKVIEAHEGRIWCVSDRESGVRFYFTLPAHESALPRPGPMPRHSREIVEDYQRRTALSLSEDEQRSLEREKSLAASLAAFRQAHGRKLRIWVIDDEAIYCDGVRSLIKDAFWYEENVAITALADEAAALEALAQAPPDACICDVDLGPNSRDGFAVTRELRARGLRAVIHLHSNRSIPADYRNAIEVGADAFLPKPMSRPHLLRLLAETIREAAARDRDLLAGWPRQVRGERAGPSLRDGVPSFDDPEHPFPHSLGERPMVEGATSEVPEALRPASVAGSGMVVREGSVTVDPEEPTAATIILIDDDIFMRKAWMGRVHDARVLAYRGPAEFWAVYGVEGAVWPSIGAIITDFHFGPDEEETLPRFLHGLRAAGYQGPIVLSSDTVEGDSVADWIDLRIDKRPLAWRELQALLEEARS